MGKNFAHNEPVCQTIEFLKEKTATFATVFSTRPSDKREKKKEFVTDFLPISRLSILFLLESDYSF